ncbi:MAG: FAD-dependent oxidoreductase, partial [Actinomycetes bacterium]
MGNWDQVPKFEEARGGRMASDDRVIVIGAGIIGASCAYHLAARGQQVTVLEKYDAPAE